MVGDTGSCLLLWTSLALFGHGHYRGHYRGHTTGALLGAVRRVGSWWHEFRYWAFKQMLRKNLLIQC